MRLLLLIFPLLLFGCATPVTHITESETNVSEATQKQAQDGRSTQNTLALKRKLAVGRLSNETTYAKSLLNSSASDKMSNKLTDMFVQSLINSDNYLIFERPDIELLKAESTLSGQEVNIIGVDTLVIGSLTEFGRVTTGENGFLSSSKKQMVTATVDLRLVDTKTGQVYESVTGTGTSSTETSNVMGFGSVATYDGSLNDQAIGAAVNSAVTKLTQLMLSKVWSSDILAVEEQIIYISGGKSQGIIPGMEFDVFQKGRVIKSQTTGANITLPGKKIGSLIISETFGDSELEEGSFGTLSTGDISSLDISSIEVREAK